MYWKLVQFESSKSCCSRLAKLLVKHKFKEAEEFCGLFQLDVEEVHRSRAQYLCDLLNPWHNTDATASLALLDMEAGSR